MNCQILTTGDIDKILTTSKRNNFMFASRTNSSSVYWCPVDFDMVNVQSSKLSK